jgi:hypothetical protein
MRDRLRARWEAWRVSRRQRKWTQRLEKCEREKHALRACGTGGKPGKSCAQCGYYMEISRQEFKALFGVSFNKAMAEHREQTV